MPLSHDRSPTLPPLAALRCFEAAARHGGYVAAATELGVTPGAIGHQIRQLEAWLGRSLFDRLAQGVSLTADGRDYATRIRGVFDQISAATRVVRHGTTPTVVIRAQYSLASAWLAPRLQRFHANRPDIDVRLIAGADLFDSRADGSDISIYYSRGPAPGVRQAHLFDSEMIAVAAPSLLARLPAGLQPHDLLTQPLIHVHLVGIAWSEPGWGHWFAAAGVAAPGVLGGLSVNMHSLAQEAAIAGAGFALTVAAFAAEALKAGELATPFDLSVLSPNAYFATVSEADLARPEVAAAYDWLVEEARP